MTKSEKATIADVIGMLNAISNKQEEQSEDQPSNQDTSKEDVKFIKELAEDTKDCIGVTFEIPCVRNDGKFSVYRGQFTANTWHALLTAFLGKNIITNFLKNEEA